VIAKHTCENKIYYEDSLVAVSLNSIPLDETRAITLITKKKIQLNPGEQEIKKTFCYNMIVFEVL